MADLTDLEFDATQVEPATGFDPLPAGKYLAVVTDSEWKETKSRTGRYLNLTFEVLDGELKGRKLWARLNLDNPNPQAVQIARAEFSALCRAVGILQPKESAELHDVPLVITVKCKRRDDGEISNEIKGYARREFTAAPASTASSTPPWKR